MFDQVNNCEDSDDNTEVLQAIEFNEALVRLSVLYGPLYVLPGSHAQSPPFLRKPSEFLCSCSCSTKVVVSGSGVWGLWSVCAGATPGSAKGATWRTMSSSRQRTTRSLCGW